MITTTFIYYTNSYYHGFLIKTTFIYLKYTFDRISCVSTEFNFHKNIIFQYSFSTILVAMVAIIYSNCHARWFNFKSVIISICLKNPGYQLLNIYIISQNNLWYLVITQVSHPLLTVPGSVARMTQKDHSGLAYSILVFLPDGKQQNETRLL